MYHDLWYPVMLDFGYHYGSFSLVWNGKILIWSFQYDFSKVFGYSLHNNAINIKIQFHNK